MVVSFLYLFLAILGLAFLIFIHELGHYFMARRVGMRVETFSIGFGKPIYAWERDGVKWQVGWLPFGGYVKIAGTEKEGNREPYDIPDGFFGKKPIDRIKVALMGPLVNLVFAFIIFGALWVGGGREKSFSEFTSRIGWVDPKSALFAQGVRPGDIVTHYSGQQFQSSKDHLYAPMTALSEIEVKGLHIDEKSGAETPFEYQVSVYQHPEALEKGIVTTGIIESASYLIYNPPGEDPQTLPEGSPMSESDIQRGDRLLWVDGELIYSLKHLSRIINKGKAFFTIQRNDQIMHARVPRVLVEELKTGTDFKEEIRDWQFEADLNGIKTSKLTFIPYNITSDAIVEYPLPFIDKESEEEAFPKFTLSSLEQPLKKGDKIIAVDGMSIQKAEQLLSHLQHHHVNIIVQKDGDRLKKIAWKEADADFNTNIDWNALDRIVSRIGLGSPVTSLGNLRLLNPVMPKRRSEFLTTPEAQAAFATSLLEQKKELEEIEDPEKKAQALLLLESREKQLLLGLPIQDRKVDYNPNPKELFLSVFQEVWRTLTALLTGSLSPKWISGPVGIVQIAHHNWMIGIKEALFWLGAISLNLGVLNLLPIPVLDGGTICFSLFEITTGKKLKVATMEKLIIPFAILLIGFFIFVTYNDLVRLFKTLLM